MIAVVTGGSGFIGQNLVRRFLAEGHVVRCLVRPGGGTPPPGATRHLVDFGSPASLLATPALEDADCVIHLAGVTKAVHPREFTEANVTPTRHLLGALVARRQRPRFVFVSSQAAAGPAPALDRPIDEEDTARPVEAYGRSKLEAERIVETFSDRIATTIVRPCAVFGPRDRDFLTMFRCAEHGFVAYPGTAAHFMSLLHVDDVVSGIIAAATEEAAILRTYFLASDDPVRWRTLGEHIADASGRHVRHVNLARPVVRTASIAGDVISRLTGRAVLANTEKASLSRYPYWVCSANRARAELGVEMSRSLPAAIRETYLWYRQHGWLGGTRAARATVA